MNVFQKTLVVAILTLMGVSNAYGKQATLDVSLAHPTLLSGSSQTTYVKVGLTGFDVPSAEERAPVNIALVIDRSGSMSGEKLAQAKSAAINALDMLNANDIVSVVAYDTTVSVVFPATKLTDKQAVRNAIYSINSVGNTALFAGVSKGAAEVRKFLDRNRVNRVILLSDGLANHGPSSPGELGQLGASLLAEGISVSTLGLGLDYNEDLMFQLAQRSDGNHVFIEDATQLAGVFQREFRDVLSVVAQEIKIQIRCAPGIRPVRLLNVDGDINGQNVVVHLNQLYSKQEKYAILEVAVPESAPHETKQIANVEVTYANLKTKTVDRLASAISAHFDPSPAVVESSLNKKVMAECVLQIANLQNERAVILRELGEIEEAQELLESNMGYLSKNAAALNAPKLEERAKSNYRQAQSLDEADWVKTKKQMREVQRGDRGQMPVNPNGPK